MIKHFTLHVSVNGTNVLTSGRDEVFRVTVEQHFGPVPNHNYTVTFSRRVNGRYRVLPLNFFCIWPYDWRDEGVRFSRKVSA